MYMWYNRKLILNLLIITILIFVIEFYLPVSGLPYSGNNVYEFKLDLMLLYITFLVFYLDKSYYVIYISFFLGLIQGFAIETDIGFLSFLKSLFAFLLTIIKKYNVIWNNYLKYLIIYLIYFFYFFINYLLQDCFVFTELFIISSFHSILLLSLFIIFNKVLFSSKIFKLNA